MSIILRNSEFLPLRSINFPGVYFLPLFYSTGPTYQYILSTPTSTGALQFSLLYSPSATINVMVRGIKALSDLSADTDTTIIPTPWHDIMIGFAAWYGFQSLDDSRAANEFQVAEGRIADMARTFNQDLGRHRITRRVDQDNYFGPRWSLPSNYGPEIGGY